jgi:hypothetical protein
MFDPFPLLNQPQPSSSPAQFIQNPVQSIPRPSSLQSLTNNSPNKFPNFLRQQKWFIISQLSEEMSTIQTKSFQFPSHQDNKSSSNICQSTLLFPKHTFNPLKQCQCPTLKSSTLPLILLSQCWQGQHHKIYHKGRGVPWAVIPMISYRYLLIALARISIQDKLGCPHPSRLRRELGSNIGEII